MRLYARGPRAVWQVASDLGMVAWVLLCAWLARTARQTVEGIGVVPREAGSGLKVAIEQLDKISRALARVPEVGDSLGVPFRSLSRLLWDMVAHSEDQAVSINSAAQTLGVLVFIVPVGLMVALWLPRRVTFVQEASFSQRFIDDEADLDLFALRAMAHVPMKQLAGVSGDPVAAWRDGDSEVIARLAELELERIGLKLPRRNVVASTAPPEWDD